MNNYNQIAITNAQYKLLVKLSTSFEYQMRLVDFRAKIKGEINYDDAIRTFQSEFLVVISTDHTYNDQTGNIDLIGDEYITLTSHGYSYMQFFREQQRREYLKPALVAGAVSIPVTVLTTLIVQLLLH